MFILPPGSPKLPVATMACRFPDKVRGFVCTMFSTFNSLFPLLQLCAVLPVINVHVVRISSKLTPFYKLHYAVILKFQQFWFQAEYRKFG